MLNLKTDLKPIPKIRHGSKFWFHVSIIKEEKKLHLDRFFTTKFKHQKVLPIKVKNK